MRSEIFVPISSIPLLWVSAISLTAWSRSTMAASWSSWSWTVSRTTRAASSLEVRATAMMRTSCFFLLIVGVGFGFEIREFEISKAWLIQRDGMGGGRGDGHGGDGDDRGAGRLAGCVRLVVSDE